MSTSIFKDAARIFSKVDMSGECWLWTGQLDRDGYGKVTVGSRAVGNYRTGVRPHRWVYEYVVGPIPEGLQADHLCQERRCVNPAHLEPVTLLVNQSRKRVKREPQDHCASGRHLMAESAKFHSTGKRYCGTCSREQRAAKYQRQKDAA